MAEGKVTVSQDVFDTFEDPSTKAVKTVDRFTLENEMGGVKVQIISWGATINSIRMPGKDGQAAKDIVLGFDNMAGYLSAENPYFGAVIGRVSNRIWRGKFIIEGKEYNVPVNNGPNSLHGGKVGFDKKLWQGKIIGNKVIFTVLSEDGDQGYPGDVLAQVSYQLMEDNQLKIDYQAMTTKATPIAMTNHCYFNLDGHDSADKKLEGHWAQFNCDRWTPTDLDLLPKGNVESVEGTQFDLRIPKNVANLLKKFLPGPNGYDNNLCVSGWEEGKKRELKFVGRMQHDGSGRVIEVYSDQPGIQFYSGNFLPDPENQEKPVVGKGGAQYWKHGAFCLETQNWPNAVNFKNFPNAILQPGEIYRHSAVFRLYVVQ